MLVEVARVEEACRQGRLQVCRFGDRVGMEGQSGRRLWKSKGLNAVEESGV